MCQLDWIARPGWSQIIVITSAMNIDYENINVLAGKICEHKNFLRNDEYVETLNLTRLR